MKKLYFYLLFSFLFLTHSFLTVCSSESSTAPTTSKKKGTKRKKSSHAKSSAAGRQSAPALPSNPAFSSLQHLSTACVLAQAHFTPADFEQLKNENDALKEDLKTTRKTLSKFQSTLATREKDLLAERKKSDDQEKIFIQQLNALTREQSEQIKQMRADFTARSQQLEVKLKEKIKEFDATKKSLSVTQKLFRQLQDRFLAVSQEKKNIAQELADEKRKKEQLREAVQSGADLYLESDIV